STGASLQLIKMDESRGIIENCKRICNKVRVEALVIKESDFDAVATSQNLSPEEAKIHKFDQERSIPDTMALKRFYMRNLYDKDMNIEDWNNLSEENLEKSIVEDLCKTYSANHWKVIKELFKILGFTGINDKRVLPGNIISEAFIQSCKRFIEI
ncbi:19950_t:CDS:2, partial [Funneliformis geosporum]